MLFYFIQPIENELINSITLKTLDLCNLLAALISNIAYSGRSGGAGGPFAGDERHYRNSLDIHARV